MEEASDGGMEELDRDCEAGIACGMGTRREEQRAKKTEIRRGENQGIHKISVSSPLHKDTDSQV